MKRMESIARNRSKSVNRSTTFKDDFLFQDGDEQPQAGRDRKFPNIDGISPINESNVWTNISNNNSVGFGQVKKENKTSERAVMERNTTSTMSHKGQSMPSLTYIGNKTRSSRRRAVPLVEPNHRFSYVPSWNQTSISQEFTQSTSLREVSRSESTRKGARQKGELLPETIRLINENQDLYNPDTVVKHIRKVAVNCLRDFKLGKLQPKRGTEIVDGLPVTSGEQPCSSRSTYKGRQRCVHKLLKVCQNVLSSELPPLASQSSKIRLTQSLASLKEPQKISTLDKNADEENSQEETDTPDTEVDQKERLSKRVDSLTRLYFKNLTTDSFIAKKTQSLEDQRKLYPSQPRKVKVSPGCKFEEGKSVKVISKLDNLNFWLTPTSLVNVGPDREEDALAQCAKANDTNDKVVVFGSLPARKEVDWSTFRDTEASDSLMNSMARVRLNRSRLQTTQHNSGAYYVSQARQQFAEDSNRAWMSTRLIAQGQWTSLCPRNLQKPRRALRSSRGKIKPSVKQFSTEKTPEENESYFSDSILSEETSDVTQRGNYHSASSGTTSIRGAEGKGVPVAFSPDRKKYLEGEKTAATSPSSASDQTSERSIFRFSDTGSRGEKVVAFIDSKQRLESDSHLSARLSSAPDIGIRVVKTLGLSQRIPHNNLAKVRGQQKVEYLDKSVARSDPLPGMKAGVGMHGAVSRGGVGRGKNPLISKFTTKDQHSEILSARARGFGSLKGKEGAIGYKDKEPPSNDAASEASSSGTLQVTNPANKASPSEGTAAPYYALEGRRSFGSFGGNTVLFGNDRASAQYDGQDSHIIPGVFQEPPSRNSIPSNRRNSMPSIDKRRESFKRVSFRDLGEGSAQDVLYRRRSEDNKVQTSGSVTRASVDSNGVRASLSLGGRASFSTSFPNLGDDQNRAGRQPQRNIDAERRQKMGYAEEVIFDDNHVKHRPRHDHEEVFYDQGDLRPGKAVGQGYDSTRRSRRKSDTPDKIDGQGKSQRGSSFIREIGPRYVNHDQRWSFMNSEQIWHQKYITREPLVKPPD